MTTKAEWKLATNNARCPWCEAQGQIVVTTADGEYGTAYTFSCNCRGRHEYYKFTVVKKPKTPPFIRFKLTYDGKLADKKRDGGAVALAKKMLEDIQEP